MALFLNSNTFMICDISGFLQNLSKIRICQDFRFQALTGFLFAINTLKNFNYNNEINFKQ